MLKKAVMGLVVLCSVGMMGCNSQGALVVGGVVTALAGGVIEIGELIAKLFGAE
jgi:hypothetical protein